MKGQVAIENLMTYGWMLLAVALVSGSLLGSGLAGSCQQGISGFSVHQLKAVEFGYSQGELLLRLGNDDTEGLQHNITEINVSSAETGKSRVIRPSEKLGVDREENFALNGFEQGEECTKLDIRITYQRGSILKGQKATGTLISYVRPET